jgi:general secretion pathway protein G
MRHRGFTLIELMLVVAVIAVLAGLMLAAMGGVQSRAARNRAEAEISAMEVALDRYKSRNGDFPAVDNSARRLTEALGPYLDLNSGQSNSTGQLVDPFGTAYFYSYPPQNNFVKPDIASAGSDGQSGTADDIRNW